MTKKKSRRNRLQWAKDVVVFILLLPLASHDKEGLYDLFPQGSILSTEFALVDPTIQDQTHSRPLNRWVQLLIDSIPSWKMLSSLFELLDVEYSMLLNHLIFNLNLQLIIGTFCV